MISLVRIDERLIHGQVAYAWILAYKSDAIMVIDNEISTDQFQKDLLALACPKDTKCLIVNEERAVELLQKYENKKIFIVVKNPLTLLHIMEKGINLKSINVGGLYFKDNRKQYSNTVYLDDTLTEVFKMISQHGVKLEIRATPTDDSIDLMKLI